MILALRRDEFNGGAIREPRMMFNCGAECLHWCGRGVVHEQHAVGITHGNGGGVLQVGVHLFRRAREDVAPAAPQQRRDVVGGNVRGVVARGA